MRIIPVFLLVFILGACSSGGKVKKEEFTVSLLSESVQIGEIEVQFDNFLAFLSLKKAKVKVYYFPEEDAVSLQFRDVYLNYHQCWSKSGREIFADALEAYKEDYAARNLPRKASRSTIRNYGKAEGYLIWRTFDFSFSEQASASVNILLGYSFKQRMPYFCVTQSEAYYKDLQAETNSKTSPEIQMFFTRAQADELASLFDQNFLDSFISGGTRNSFRPEDIDIDIY
jgi:hypothetical protein